MIQAISTANVQTNKQSTPIRPSFARNENSYDRPHHKRSAIGWSAEQFAKGAAFSVLVSAVMGGFKSLSSKHIGGTLKEAGKWGLIWVAANLLFEGITNLANKKN